jgi:PAS domain S-box-containing protein
MRSMQTYFPFQRKNNPWSRLPVSYRGAIIIAIPATCLIVTLVAWIWSRQTALEHKQQIDRARELLDQSNRILTILVDAETGVRGYNISYEPEFLEPYEQAITNLPNALDRFRQLAKNNPRQKQALEKIEPLVQQRMSILTKRITLIERQKPLGIQLPQTVTALNEGKQVMDSLRVAIANLETQEQNILAHKQQKLDRVENITTGIQVISVLASIIAYLAAVYLFTQLDRELEDRELQLLESKYFIEAITTNIVDGVITLTNDGIIETFNSAATQMFAYEPTEAIGQNLGLLLTPTKQLSDPQEQVQFLNACPLHLDRLWQTTGYKKTGESFPIEISISQINIDKRWIAIIRNLSERQQAENQLKERAEELAYISTVLTKTNLDLQRQNQELDKFAYVASHDLKAPLRAIASLSEWIEEELCDKLSEEGQRMMMLLRGRVYRLEALMNGLLEYSRIGRLKTTIETVDVSNLLQEIINFLAPPSSFAIEIDPKMPVLRTKKRFLHEIFLSLIDNAIKHHNRTQGHIKIAVEERPNDYKFAVADDGPGIAPEFHERIFTLFQTLQPRDVVENTGIGLSLVKKILETEGGEVWIDSQLGKGSTFYFTWPKHMMNE